MSSSVEDKIVAMKFDNKQFEPAAKTTMSTLDRLKSALNMGGAGKGLTQLQNTANKFSLGKLGDGTAAVSGKFLAMATVAATAIASITSRAVTAGLNIAKAFTLDPLKQGFEEYETNLNSVQTILANTQASGAKLKDVNAALNELNAYSDKTIYNFSEMARNIGTFTAAGVDLDTSTQSIKGIANLAALSGSNSQQASTAMYQLSQAISAGRVSLQDWNSVVNAGMGGTVFQRALAQTAEKMGTLDKGAVKLSGKMKNATINGKSFRESITAKPGEQSWLTSKVLTETLKQFTGDMTDAELATMGFTKAQIKSIQAQAKTATNAATEVKTFTALMGTIKESAGSGWAQTFSILIGDFEESKALWTQVNNIVGGFLGRSANARNEMLQQWKELGGRRTVLLGLRTIFESIIAIAKPIGQAFREIFPAMTAKQLYALTLSFYEFTKRLKMGADDLKDVKRTAKGFFALLSIGVQIVSGILRVVGKLFGIVADGSGGFLSTTASIGDFLVKLDETIKKGDLINKFFDTLGAGLEFIVDVLKGAGTAFIGLFDGLDVSDFQKLGDAFKRISQRLEPLSKLAGKVSGAWTVLMGVFKKIGEFLAPVGNAIKNALSGIGDTIAEAFRAGDFTSVFDAINTGLLAGIIILIKKFMDKGLNINFGGGFVESIKSTFGALTDTLSAMQNNIQAKTLLLIAGAVAILVASIFVLSTIDSKKLASALAGITVAFGQLMAAMAILSKITASGGFLKIPFIAGSMILLSTAVLILAAAVKVFSGMSWEEIAKGLVGVGASLAILVNAARGLDKSGGAMVRAGIAMIPMSVGLLILSKAVQSFGSMKWSEIGKGLVAMAGALTIVAAAVSFMPPTMILAAAGLVVFAAGLVILGQAMKSFGDMKWGEIAKSLVVLAGSLALITAAVLLMPPTMILQAAGLVIFAAGLVILAQAMKSFGGMKWGEIAKALVVLAGSLVLITAAVLLMPPTMILSAVALGMIAAALIVMGQALKSFGGMTWGEIAKSMVVLAASLGILAVGLTLMIAALPGAAALTVATAALAVFVPILIVLGTMSWKVIAQGLGAIALAFGVLGISALLLLPVVPAILALSASLLVLGVAMALTGVGALALATAFSIFVGAGAAGLVVFTGMINLIPLFMTKFAEGIIAFATTIATQGAKFTKAFTVLLVSLLDAVIKIVPKIGKLITTLLQTILRIISDNSPKIAQVGIKLMESFLRALSGRVPTLVRLAGDIIVKFLNGMSKQVPRIAKVGTDLIAKVMSAVSSSQGKLLQQGATMIISFINNLAGTIRSNSGALNSAGANLAGAIISGMTGGIWAGISGVANAARSVAQSAVNAAKAALKINSPSKVFHDIGSWSSEGMAEGLLYASKSVDSASEKVAKSALTTIQESMSGVSDLISADMNLSPTVTPIIDLTKFSQDANKMSGYFDQNALSTELSYGRAADISQRERERKDDMDTSAAVAGATNINLEQNNYSPKALSATEIYRNTKSQIAQAKEAFDK